MQARLAGFGALMLFTFGTIAFYSLDGTRATQAEVDGAQRGAALFIAFAVVMALVAVVVTTVVMNVLAKGDDDDDVPPGIY
jgi:hypothetical protein